MLAKVIALACFRALCGVGAALAQTDGPAEQPAADYLGQSYVDSNGCIFLKAGYGGEATWVPRVGQDRKPICGQTPTNAVAKVSDAAASKVPVVAKSRMQKHRVKAVAPREPVMIGCPVSVPVARRYATTDGGSVVICTATNGSLTGARSPIYPAGSGVGAALSSSRYAGVVVPLSESQAVDAQASAAITPPPGYQAAWKDGRFNPLRGKSMLPDAGAQAEIPAVDTAEVAIAAKPPTATKSTGASTADGATFYVQVGAFGEPTNADGATARLMALGLPVSKGKFSKQGKMLQVIYAGPFASGGDAQAALFAARGNGFSDAFIR